MGIPFTQSFQQFFERVSMPLHEIFHAADKAAGEDHELLWDCYAAGQMSDGELEREIAADPDFAAFVRAREKRFH